jgi:hypothetical protein
MKIHPLVAAMTLVLVGVTALGATLVVRRRAARARPPVAPPEEPAPPPRAPRLVFAAPPLPGLAPPPAPAAPAGDTLRVRVVGPHGLLVPGVSVTAVDLDADPDADATTYELEATADDADGTWSASELPPGRYGVVVEAPDMREAHAKGVVPSEDVVSVALARAALVRGSIGAPRLDGCGGGAVHVKDLSAASDGDATSDAYGLGADDDSVDVDEGDCTFAVPSPRDEGPLLVTATWGQRVERALVTVPAEGDPAPVCFGPPCAAAPATLAVYVADDAGRLTEDASVEWTLLGDEQNGAGGGSYGRGLVFVHDRRAGETVRVEASIDDVRAETTVVVGPGVTEVVLTVAGGPARAVTPRAGRRIRLGDGEGVGLP